MENTVGAFDETIEGKGKPLEKHDVETPYECVKSVRYVKLKREATNSNTNTFHMI